MGRIRKPKLSEVEAIRLLIDAAAADGQVLPRDLAELYTNVRDFYVYVDEEGVGGCVALHIDMIDLAEVRSLVVRAGLRGQGVGARLVESALEEARDLDIGRVYTLTREPTFFLRCGFQSLSKDDLPYKVFKDCARCPRFSDCDEVALARTLKTDDTMAAETASHEEG